MSIIFIVVYYAIRANKPGEEQSKQVSRGEKKIGQQGNKAIRPAGKKSK